ncbi:hypothetical protein BDN72DRAFT_845831 [Pluteus cervinus]|uniref:Uncharacterized protein n=1 Tax=Pluteus cervinus TaxID=181527 RepID=A0ACD3AJZ0_9AGAR|nr:hypothetical protein BDN72DRAFT_845831 [Pluteus cervinus]
MGNPRMDQYTPRKHGPGDYPDTELAYITPAWAKPQANGHRHRHLIGFVLLGCAFGAAFLYSRSVHPIHQVIKASKPPHISTAVSSVFPSDVDVGECIEWGAKNTSWWNSAASSTIRFPLNMDSLFFLREGTPIDGTFQVFEADPTKYEPGKVHVELSISSRYEGFIDQTKVCHLTKEGGGDGLGIMADFTHSWFDNTKIDVTVRIPIPESGEELKISNFETDLPYIRQVLYTSYPITFGNLKLSGQGQDVDAVGIVADTVDMRTSDALVGGLFETTGPISLFTKNGMVSGRFNTSSTVSLVTSNAPISAIAYLKNDESTGQAAELIMQTTNGAIDGTISLESLADDGFGGWFNISTTTSNGASHLKLMSISPRAKLDLTAHTTGSSDGAAVELGPGYEGAFNLETAPGSKAEVDIWPFSVHQDPEHRGRKRAALVINNHNKAEGRVWWDSDGQDLGRGTIEIMSTSGKVGLKV